MSYEEFDHTDFDRLQEIASDHGIELRKKPFNPYSEHMSEIVDTPITRYLELLTKYDSHRRQIKTVRYTLNEGQPLVFNGMEGQRAFLFETYHSGKLIRIDLNTHSNIEWKRPKVSQMLQSYETMGFNSNDGEVFVELLPYVMPMDIAIQQGYATQAGLERWVENSKRRLASYTNLKFDDIYPTNGFTENTNLPVKAAQFGLIYLPSGHRQIVTLDAGCLQLSNRTISRFLGLNSDTPVSLIRKDRELLNKQREYREYIDRNGRVSPLSYLKINKSFQAGAADITGSM